jgi:hypothetical protein
VAIFLIVSAVMVTVTLFHSGLRYARMSQTRAVAGMYGRKVMQQIRTWAVSPANYDDSDWDEYDDVELSDPDFPGFVARVNCEPAGRQLFSPSSELEGMYLATAHTMDKPVVPVRVTVVWGQPEQQLSLVSVVGAPERELGPSPTVVLQRISGPAGPVPPLAEVRFGAQLLNSDGDAVPNVAFAWTVRSLSGSATLFRDGEPRDGSTIRLKHEFRWAPTPDGVGPVPGDVEVEAVCRYRGRKFADAVVVVLQ